MKRTLLLFIGCLLLSQLSFAQKRKQPKKPGSSDFLKTQWWLGIRSGLNFTNATPIERFPGFYPINYDEESLEKEYMDFERPAFHVGLDITFYHAGFSLSTFPTFFKHNITYESGTSWIGDAENERFETEYTTNQSVTFIDVPLALKYDILDGKVRPFAMAGAFYSFVFDANKEVAIRETDHSNYPDNPITYNRTSINSNNKDEFLNNWGVLGGIGASFDFWNIRTVIDLQYRHSFDNVVDPSARNKESLFLAIGEKQDDYHLSNYSASISFVFPLRYIDSQFKAL